MPDDTGTSLGKLFLISFSALPLNYGKCQKLQLGTKSGRNGNADRDLVKKKEPAHASLFCCRIPTADLF